MEPKKKLAQQTMEEKLAGLAAAANGGMPVYPNSTLQPMEDNRMTQSDEDRMRAVQLMQLANSPTRGIVQPNAAALAAQDADMQAQLDELGEGVEVPAQPQKRFQRLLGK